MAMFSVFILFVIRSHLYWVVGLFAPFMFRALRVSLLMLGWYVGL